MAVTIRASEDGLAKVDEARKKRGWTAKALAWCEAAKVSQATLKRFRERHRIQREAFITICAALDIEDWEEIAEFSSQTDINSAQDNSDDTKRNEEKRAAKDPKYNFVNSNIGNATFDSNIYGNQIGTQYNTYNQKADNLEFNVFKEIQSGSNLTTGDITVNLSEDPKKRAAQAQKLLATEIITNISNLDARLGFVETSLAPDLVKEHLQITRDKVAPSFNSQANLGYDRLMFQQAVPALRQALNSRPLRLNAGSAIIPILIDGDIDPQPVQAFYNRLTDVQDVAESLLNTLSEAASSKRLTESETAEYYQARLDLDVKRLQNRSMLTHLSGLMTLNHLAVDPTLLNIQFASLQCLKPKKVVDKEILIQNLKEYSLEAEQLLIQRAELLENGEQLLAQALKAYEEINEMLSIKPTDTWGQVVGKAISLRQLGRTTEALAAFDKYGNMFAETFPMAQDYAKTAQQLTMQIEDLGINGGVYIYELVEDGGAQKAGIPVGAIVIDYGGHSIKNMDDLVSALKKVPTGELVFITYLTINQSLSFKQQMKKVVGGSLGAGFMPI